MPAVREITPKRPQFASKVEPRSAEHLVRAGAWLDRDLGRRGEVLGELDRAAAADAVPKRP
jgi:hypothetical protein